MAAYNRDHVLLRESGAVPSTGHFFFRQVIAIMFAYVVVGLDRGSVLSAADRSALV